MLAWQHLTTANQRIKLAKRVLSLLPNIQKKLPATRKMRHACMAAFDESKAGFIQSFLDRFYDQLGSVRRIFGVREVFQGLGFTDLFGKALDGRLDQRKHGGDGIIQVGETDGIDVVFIDGDFHFQGDIIQCHRRGVNAGSEFFGVSGVAFVFFRKEHDGKQNDQQNAENDEDCSVDQFFHMQYNDFGF